MQFIPVRSLRNTPGAVQELLRTNGDVVLTAHGEPIALLVPIDGDLAVAMQTLRRARAQQAVSDMRAEAAKLGLDKWSDEQIAQEIAAYRAEQSNP